MQPVASKSPIRCSSHTTLHAWRFRGGGKGEGREGGRENEYERYEKAKTRKLDFLAVGQAKKAIF